MNNIIELARRQHLIQHRIEEMHLRKERTSTYLVFDAEAGDINYFWDLQDVLEIDHMWEYGLSVDDIAKAFNRSVDEVVLLLMDRARKGKIKIRQGGFYGQSVLLCSRCKGGI